MRNRIVLTGEDAQLFVRAGATTWPDRALVYLDPPYYVKGRQLYYDYYCHADHVELARKVQAGLVRPKWIVSYDNVPAIREIYVKCRYITYSIGYSARGTRQGSEVMFFCDGLSVPLITGPLQEIERAAA
jgi:DNA adenine methylase